jgi:hypothetical protein
VRQADANKLKPRVDPDEAGAGAGGAEAVISDRIAHLGTFRGMDRPTEAGVILRHSRRHVRAGGFFVFFGAREKARGRGVGG